MARIEDIDRRLHNWARWRLGMTVGGLGFASVDMASEGIHSTAEDECRVPTNDIEAEETHRAVMALAGELRATVEEVYLRGGSVKRQAQRLCCAEVTVHARISKAHLSIQRWVAELHAQQRQQRATVEAMQAAARPK
ncbi:hypothetical protein [Ideonella paludis]|uniref:RNA polymerase sigma factor 70 region 4 type 2 domain-containing protein n=1 Tax=Ideonella paludis TaxID=1233411 RepID=A0ABS5DU30_9BURK|nr:hypothetical protein [Ideonella paludis]MBQ0934637.1 hypothetical protein [Ideonella paludis]